MIFKAPHSANTFLWLGTVALFFMLYQLQPNHTILMAPVPDNKVEQAYRRNGFGDKIMTTERRQQLSTCYKNMLRSNGYDEVNPTPKPGTETHSNQKFEGKVTFVFQVDEDGTMLNYELAETDFKDKRFSECISNSLVGIRFLPPPLGINRFLAHEFLFKSEDTFKRELEERKNQTPLTLVTATPSPTTEDALTKK